MDIAELPDHIFIDIAKYLSHVDLLSCSLVSVAWRNAVNCNDIWRYICKNTMICKIGNELDYIPNLVTKCVDPYSASKFEPLCKWRKTYMRWRKLQSNWLKGRFKKFCIKEPLSIFFIVELDDNYALIVYDDLREISVWNIKKAPYHQENIKFCLSHVSFDFVKLVNNVLVIVQCNLLQVFRSTENGFILYHRCIFNQQESYLKQLPHEHNITDWYCSNINPYPCDLAVRCEQNGDKFIGLILDGNYNRTVLHIWDLKTRVKDIEVPMPQSSDTVRDVIFYVSEKYLYIKLQNFKRGKHYHSLYAYDLKKLEFINFKIRFPSIVPQFLVYKDIIMTVGDKMRQLDIWKINSNLSKTIVCNFKINSSCFKVECSHLLIGGICSLSTKILVYNLNNLKCVFTTSVSHTVKFISLVQNKFLIVGAFYRNNFCSVLDISNNCILYDINDVNCIFVNSIHSKLLSLVDRKLKIITFW